MTFHLPENRTTRPRGQALPEYALILALVTVFCLAALSLFGQSFSNFFTTFANAIADAAAAAMPPGF